jgi:hypothetical protein
VTGSRNFSRRNAPLALRLRIDDLNAQLAPMDSYGLTGFGLAIGDGMRALIRAWRNALRGIAGCAPECGSDCEAI